MIYLCVIQISFFASQKANLSGVTLARTPDRREVLSFSDHFETEGFSFLVKRVPATENLTTIPELAKAPKMAFAMKTGGMQSDYFEAHPKGTPEALIYKRFKVRGTMLSNGMGIRSKPL